MSDARPAASVTSDDLPHESCPAFPASETRPVWVTRLTPRANGPDPLEEALLARCPCSSVGPDARVRAILRRLAALDRGDEGSMGAEGDLPGAERLVPRLTVSLDVLDELELDHCAALVLAHIDGRTDLSHILNGCALPRAETLRTLCVLIDRHIVVVRGAQ